MHQLIDFLRAIAAEVADYKLAIFLIGPTTTAGLIPLIIITAFVCYCCHAPNNTCNPLPRDQAHAPLLNLELKI